MARITRLDKDGIAYIGALDLYASPTTWAPYIRSLMYTTRQEAPRDRGDIVPVHLNPESMQYEVTLHEAIRIGTLPGTSGRLSLLPVVLLDTDGTHLTVPVQYRADW